MKFIQLIIQISFLYFLYYIGTLIQEIFNLMIPGSIIGMLLLFCLLHFPFFKEMWVKSGSLFLTKHLTLLFIPATVGIIQYSSLLNLNGLISIIIVLFSTFLVFILTASVSSFISSRPSKQQNKDIILGRDTNERV